MKTLRVKQLADRLRKHPSTIFRWLKLGLNIDDEKSIEQFLSGDKDRRHRNTVRKPRRENTSAEPVAEPQESEHVPGHLNSIELAPVGRRGAAAALQRLEQTEERAHARLMRAIEHGNQFEIKNAQEFFLRSSETLRRLDLAVETERRTALEQVPMRQVESVAVQISTWLRSAFEQFLSAESPGLMGINDLGEFKACSVHQFKGLLHAVVKTSLKTQPIPLGRLIGSEKLGILVPITNAEANWSLLPRL